MSAACEALGTPVISGNVSLYNETLGAAVYPTPVVGMLGLIEDLDHRCASPFQHEGDAVVLVHPHPSPSHPAPGTALAGSEYLKLAHGLVAGRPEIDLEAERAVQRCVLAAIRAGLLSSAHDCSDGGLAVALAECAVWSGLGFDGAACVVRGAALGERLDAALFGEAQSRFVVSVAARKLEALARLAGEHGVAVTHVGTVGGDRFRLGDVLDVPLAALVDAYEGGIPAALGVSV
jgi:phosphoribosylformylglycinamidine synthase